MKRRDIFKYFTASGIGAVIGVRMSSKATAPHPEVLIKTGRVTPAVRLLAGLPSVGETKVGQQYQCQGSVFENDGIAWRLIHGPIRPEMFSGTDTAKVQAALNAGATYAGEVALDGAYTTTGLTASAVRIIGTGSITLTAGLLALTDCEIDDSVTITGNGKTNNANCIALSGDCKIGPFVTVKEAHYNAIVAIASCTSARIYCRIDDCGGAGIDVTYQGCGVYVQPGATDVQVYSEISRTAGQGACYFNSAINSGFYGYAHHVQRRGVVVFGGATQDVTIQGAKIRYCGEGNLTGSNIGCNGIYVDNSVPSALQVVVKDCDVRYVGENCYEGKAQFLNNYGSHTDFYPGTLTGSPSTEGIYLLTGASARGNELENIASEGILVGGVALSFTNISIAYNIIRQIGAGFEFIKVSGISGTTLENIEIIGNVFFDAAAIALACVSVVPGASTFNAKSIRVADNHGYGNNVFNLPDGIIAYGNMESARNIYEFEANDANGGFMRKATGYGIRYDGANFILDTGTRTLIAHDNGGVAVFVVPSSVSSPISRATLNTYRVLSTSLPVYDTEIAAVSGGLTSGQWYRTATGEMRVKL